MAVDMTESGSNFWNIHFTDTLFNKFYEHPPLGIFTMSIPFYIFGDSLLIDKLYGTVFGILIATVMALIIGLLYKGQRRNTLLLSLFYFLAFPITSNTLENNLLEIPATFFILLSVYIFLKYALTSQNRIIYSLLFTFALLASFLVKGPVTLFPLALPFFFFVLFSSTYLFKEMLKFYALVSIFTVLFSFFLYIYPDSNFYLSTYFQNQILNSIDGSRGGDEYFKLTSQLLIDLSAIVIISLLAIFIGHRKFVRLKFSKIFWLFIFIGLSGSLPLEVSPRQHDYYIFPSLAFFAIAFGILFVEPTTSLLRKFYSYKFTAALNIVMLVVLIIIISDKIGSNSRYKNFYNDFIKEAVNIDRGSKITACVANPTDYDKFFNNIGLKANLKRHFNAEIDFTNENKNYYLTTKESLLKCIPNTKEYFYIGPKDPQYYLLYKKLKSK